jgi:hypothetical protein
MSKFTSTQKKAFLDLAQRYNAIVFAIVERGSEDEISIRSSEEADALDGFAETLTSLVMRDFPDYAGRDENIHADAELVVHMVTDILADHDKSR